MRATCLIAIAVVCVLPAPAVRAGARRTSMVVTVDWLARNLQDPTLVLLHVGDRAGYDAGHIPGARYISTRDISLPRQEGALALELPPVAQVVDAFEKLGVSNGSRVVVYFGSDWISPTTRVIFTLDWLGLGDCVALLDGGMPAWTAAKHPVSAAVTSPTRGRITPSPRKNVVVDAAWVKERLDRPSVAVIDARRTQFYAGSDEGGQPRAGHIPGARNVPFTSLFDEAGLTLKSVDTLRGLLEAADAGPDKTIAVYCHIGQQATVVWFAARYLGYDDVRLYDGSFQDWSRTATLPVVGPPDAPSVPPKSGTP